MLSELGVAQQQMALDVQQGLERTDALGAEAQAVRESLERSRREHEALAALAQGQARALSAQLADLAQEEQGRAADAQHRWRVRAVGGRTARASGGRGPAEGTGLRAGAAPQLLWLSA